MKKKKKKPITVLLPENILDMLRKNGNIISNTIEQIIDNYCNKVLEGLTDGENALG